MKFEIWLSNLNPQRGTEVGKVRPVLIVKTPLMTELSESTIICPFTTTPSTSRITKVKVEASDTSGLTTQSWIIIDQIRTIDKKRLIKKLGELPEHYHDQVNQNLKIMLDLD
ncbi:MAG: type II toxin-antitoxin system PemK/MazF family toxin [Cyclobacteriaceae bacterium]